MEHDKDETQLVSVCQTAFTTIKGPIFKKSNSFCKKTMVLFKLKTVKIN